MHPAETVLAQTQASFAMFGLRFAFRVGLTLPLVMVTVFLVYPITPLYFLFTFLAAPVVTAVYGLIFSDHLAWLSARGSRWVLTDRRLLLLAPQDPQADVPLTAITQVRRWMWWSLRLRLSNRQSLRLDFIDKPAQFRDHLIAALPPGKETP